jgi:F-type H+-transporting ATPase subunit epsilon|tara:strand:- start:9559 stop:9960 length:402 start_codon:yes stop_codon:yes gene_type:complete
MGVKIKVISPEKMIWDTEAEEIVLPSITGGLGILTNHAPLVTVLQTGLLKKREKNGWLPLILWGGVAQIENNEIVVLANGVEEISEKTMTLDEANKKVLDLLDETSKETEPNKKLMLETEIAKARVEALTLIK